MKKELTVHSLEETQQFAIKLAAHLTPPDVITLEGDLGAGKTTFTQALAKALGVTRTVSSPTFTIMKQYEGKHPINHLDVYRLAGSDEDLGLDELFFGEAISIIEWAHLIEEDLPTERLELRFTHTGENQRLITITALGERYKNICEEIFL